MKPTELGKKVWKIGKLSEKIGYGMFAVSHEYRFCVWLICKHTEDIILASNPTEIKALLDMNLIEFEK